MRILYLGPYSPLIEFLESQDNLVIRREDKINGYIIQTLGEPNFLISYGYRHILRKDVLDLFYPDRAINLHISYLPWNRGADPNFWSFAENTPKGVTIHYIDEGMDTGDIIVQKEVFFNDEETLRSTYDKLQNEIRDLFIKNWLSISEGICQRHKQNTIGSTHRSKDKEPFLHLLTSGLNTPIGSLTGKALKT